MLVTVVCPDCKEQKDQYIDAWQMKIERDRGKTGSIEIPCGICWLIHHAKANDGLDRITRSVMVKLYPDKA